MKVALAVTYHDSEGRLCGQIQRVLPVLDGIFSGMAVRASSTASEQALSLFVDAGALVRQESPEQAGEGPRLGAVRDVTWPLYLKSTGGFSLGYIEAGGLEFETSARCGDEIEAVGGYSEWLKERDSDVNRWVRRLDIARTHVEAMKPFRKRPG